jgi:flagellar hook assembly protein FlgD
MTSITPIDSSTLSAETQASAPIKILGKNDFLNLLVTQLQHHDNLKNMELFQTSMTNSQAVSYIGKEITAKGNTVQLESVRPVDCQFELEANAALVAISVYDVKKPDR